MKEFSDKQIKLVANASASSSEPVPPGPPGPTATVTGSPPPTTVIIGGGGGGGGDSDGGDGSPPPSEPAKRRAFFCQNPAFRVNIDFISDNEGGRKLNPYVPIDSKTGKPFPKSGVTVATGVDLGQYSYEEWGGRNGPAGYKLEPYFGLKGQAALDELNYYKEGDHGRGTKLKAYEARDVDDFAQRKIFSQLEKYWNNTAKFANFDQLNPNAQTTIMDVAYQYGADLASSAPNFWKYITSGDWSSAINELNDFHDDFSSRRRKDAELLSNDFKSLPSPNNKCG